MADDPQEYEEVTLADLVRTLYRRKVVLLAVFMVAVLVGVAFTVFTPKEYEAEAKVIPLENQDIIKNWLDSRNATEYVLGDLGDRLVQGLFPGQYDEASGTWEDGEPTMLEASNKLLKAVEVEAASETSVFVQGERLVTLTVTLQDPTLARDVANAYVQSLNTLRPLFEDRTREAAFAQYYDGSNEAAANQRAEVVAQNREYWIVLDHAVTPDQPSSPNVLLNIALAVVLGLLLGVFSVFFVEWVSKVRAEARPVETPRPKREPDDDEGGGFTYRGRS